MDINHRECVYEYLVHLKYQCCPACTLPVSLPALKVFV